MNPVEAITYMKGTGKPVVAEKVPHWAKDEPGIDEWIQHRYQIAHQDKILELYDDSACSAIVIKVWEVDEWLNWWMNFCYNTNSAFHNVELIPYEKNRVIV